jgi:hypothetical protein
MPVIREIKIKLGYRNIIRRQGISPSSSLRPELNTEIQEMYKLENFLEPSIAFESYEVKQANASQLTLGNGEIIVNSTIADKFSSAKRIVAAICTIGPLLEERAAKFLAQQEPLKAFILDAIGSAAIDSLGAEACSLIQTLHKGFEVSSPLGPGMEDISIREQNRIFRLASAERIGVRVNSAGMLIPQKSISMILGVGLKMPTWHRSELCNRCKIRDTCQHRIQTRKVRN